MNTIHSTIITLRRALNALLPFTDPSTPLLQDIIHTFILCAALYFAPAIFEHRPEHSSDTGSPTLGLDTNTALGEGIGVDTRGVDDADAELEHLHPQAVVDADELEDDDVEPPPLAPTPPPFRTAGVPPPPFLDPVDVGDGPAHLPGNQPRPTPQNRTIGAKKAKSLARKDQRRAYHEFVRQRSEAQRLADAEGAEEREEAMREERRRRAAVEMEIEERAKKEREARREEERREIEAERLRRERVVDTVREGLEARGLVDLEDVARKEGRDVQWVERLARASGLVGGKEVKSGVCTMITGTGWAVKLDQAVMRKVYARAVEIGLGKGDGRISWDELGSLLDEVVRARAKG
ncbi:hypothetical protein AOQ84DRAFT_392256 [Glonium stellatum]|uniref:Uncharacterized protein n=1 Tax=Glonium stellatum TaxID=574774 RepID=A0A8E2JN37_9PEZI|nr:hypothetical protein AOQ84DRAFT_392256 [Glonium stellatum]